MSDQQRKLAWGVAWRVVLMALIAVAIIVSLSQYSAADVRAVCAQHSGVAEVTDTTWFAGKGSAIVTCCDGYVGSVS